MYVFSARQKNTGFTIVEILLVVALISLIVIPLFVTYRTTRSNQALLASAEEVANHTRSAHIFARDANDRKNWGIKRIDDKSYEIYSDVNGTLSSEKKYALEPGVEFVKDFNILFQIGTGETGSDAVIEFRAINGSRMNVEILKTGVVEVISL